MGAEIREPSLDPEERHSFLRGVEQFSGLAHEAGIA